MIRAKYRCHRSCCPSASSRSPRSSTGLLISWPNKFLLVLYRPSNLRGDGEIELGKTVRGQYTMCQMLLLPLCTLVIRSLLHRSVWCRLPFSVQALLPMPIVRRVASRRVNRCETMILQDKRRSSIYCATCRISIDTATRTLGNSNRMDTSTLICVFIGICQIHRSGKLREGSYGRIPEEAHKFLQRSYHMHCL